MNCKYKHTLHEGKDDDSDAPLLPGHLRFCIRDRLIVKYTDEVDFHKG